MEKKQSRRNFLRTAALATAGTGLLLNGVGSKLMASPKPTPRYPLPGAGKMKLTFKPYEIPLAYTFSVAGSSRKTTQTVQVQIDYEGMTGYGEAVTPPYLGESAASVCAFLERVNLEQFRTPFEMDDILTYVDGITENNTSAKAAVDIALHDLVGKLIGQPWYKIWGLNVDKIEPTTYTIGIDKPDVVRKKTREYLNDFKILKVKVGGNNDREMIETIRSVTDIPLAVDANQGWKDKHQALDMINWLHEQGIVMVEQPMSKKRLDDIAWITERSPVPIYADESMQRLSDVMKLRGAFSGINIKLMKCTGMREAWKILNFVRGLNMDVMVGCMTGETCAIAAAAQLSPAVDFCDLDGNLLIDKKADLYKGATLQNGVMMPSDLPGIGVVKR